MFGIGVPELILILVVGLIVFGPGKLPEVGRSLGKGLREFRKASNALTQAINAPDPPPAAPAPQPGPEPQPQAEESPALPMAAQPAHESARDERQPVQPPLFMPSVPFDPDEWPLDPPPGNKPPARPAPLDIPAAPLTPSAPAQPALAAAEAAPKSRVDGKPSEKASRRASDKASDKAHGKSAGKTRKTAPETPKAPKSPAPHRQRPETAKAAAAAEPSFVREARQRAMWQRPGVRLAMGGAFGLLALALNLAADALAARYARRTQRLA